MVEEILLRRFAGGAPAAVAPAMLRDTLARLAIEPGPEGITGIFAGDGGEASVDLSALHAEGGLTEAVVRVSVPSLGLVALVYEIASGTGMAVSALGGSRVFLTDGDHARDLPSELVANAHTCIDPAELKWWLTREALLFDPEPGPAPAPKPRKESVTRGDALRSLFGLRRPDPD